MIVVALGYEPVAQGTGGYPTGYMMVAADRGITRGASGRVGDPALRKTVAVLLANGLDTPIMERVRFGADAEYATMDGTSGYAFKTLLNTKLDAYKIEAKITANSKTGIGVAVQKAGMVAFTIQNLLKLNPDVFNNRSNLTNVAVNDSGAENMLNYVVVLYVRELANGDFEILSASPKAGVNEFTINDSQAYDDTKDTSVSANDRTDLTHATKKIFAYWEKSRDTDSRVKTIDVDNDAVLFFNGISRGEIKNLAAADLATSGNNTLVAPKIGTIKFVDTDSDGDYDIIEVKSYTTAVVEEVNVSTGRITFIDRVKGTGKTGSAPNSIVLDKTRNTELKEWTIKDKDGADVKLEDIKKYNVIDFVTDDLQNPTYYEIIVTNTVVTGTVTEKDLVNGVYVIDGKSYKLNPLLRPAIELEDKGNFYVNMRGRITYVDTTGTTSGKYAYLYRIGVGSMNDYQIRFFDYEGRDLTVNVNDRIKINGVNTTSLITSYRGKDIKDIFKGTPFGNGFAVADATVVTVDDVAGNGSTDPLTPAGLLNLLINGGFDASVYASIAGAKNAARLVTYELNSSGELLEINIALRVNDDRVFNFVAAGSGANTEYQSNLARFRNGQSLKSNAAVFFIPTTDNTVDGDDGLISDYEVRGISSLRDGAAYTPYYFGSSTDGVGAVLLFKDSAKLDSESSIAIFNRSTTGKEGDDTVTRIYYWQDGVEVSAPLVADTEVVVQGGRANISALRTGDAFIFDVNSRNRVAKIHVLFTPGNVANRPQDPTDLDAFKNMLNVTGLTGEWKLFDDNVQGDSEIWFGYVYKREPISNGTRVMIVDPSGDFTSNETKVFNVPTSAKVVVYNTQVADNRKLNEGSNGDILVSTFPKVRNGNQTVEMVDFDSAEFTYDDMEYAFIRILNGAVKEVIVVDYNANN